jgi:RNA polymerase sigma-70 factor, ECF subfamily
MSGLRSRVAVAQPPRTDLTDEDGLVERARHDRRAFAPLYRRYVGPIYGYCYPRLGSREAAEDATSLVFAKALASLSSYRGGSVRGWLFGIAHHVVADALRARRPDEPLDAAAAVVDAAPSPEDLALAEEDRRALCAVLDHLAPEQQRVVELRLAGLTSTEIGQVLGRSRGAVDVAQHRAVVRLRELLGVPTRPEERHRGRD